MKRIGLYLVLLAIWSVPGTALAKVAVFVSIAPQKYFVQKIGQDMVDVQVLVQAGADPHTYEPKPKQMVALAGAQLYFAIGVEFEKARLEKIAAINPQLKVIYTDRGIRKIPMPVFYLDGEEKNHENGKLPAQADDGSGEDQHGHGRLDPHIWLSPPLVLKQAQTILAALQKIDPERRSVYQANYEAFSTEIADLDAELRNTFAGKHGLQFIVFHPSWGYFAHAYGLKQIPVEIEGKSPKPAQLGKLIEFATRKDIKVIFVQPQFSAKSAELIAGEIAGHVVYADPLAEDWASNLRAVAAEIRTALK